MAATERNIEQINLLRSAIQKIDTTQEQQQDDQCLNLWGILNFNDECGELLGDLMQRHPQTVSCMSFMFCMFHQDNHSASSQYQVPPSPLRAMGLQHCINLTTLHIKCCTLGDDGLKEVVDAIVNGQHIKYTLQELNVRRSQISAMGLVHVTRLLLNNGSHLKRLLLRGNEGILDDLKGVHSFCNALEANKCLEYLDLDECGANHVEAAARLFKALTMNKTLWKLDFHQSGHDDADSLFDNNNMVLIHKELIRSLPSIKGLRELRFDLFMIKHQHSRRKQHAISISLKDSDYELLITSLMRNTSLQRLTYKSKNVPDVVAQTLERNQRLAKIRLLLLLDDEESCVTMPEQVGAITTTMTTTMTNRRLRGAAARIPLALWRLVFKNLLHHDNNEDENNNNNNSAHPCSISCNNASVIFFILRNATTESGSLLVSERLCP